jgi:peptidoglycan/xylan/chitin deacetylase (PgdA/CDA1 family)/glycosyltransferase involved in cell wall biosynthesis/MoaA/NifB/PqqE/SkfB family radical SAM enzyme
MPLPSGIAVVVPCYDLGRTLEEAVDSVLEQSRSADEIVVVDDGSTDLLTRQVLARLERPRTRVIRIPHGGVAVARNHGVSLTRAPYIVLLDADDVLAEQYLERLAGRLDRDSSLAFVSSAIQAFEGASYRWTPPSTTIVGTLTRGSVHNSTMFRRHLWTAVGGFDSELAAYEDLDFWLRALRLGFRGEVLDEPLLFYRVRKDSRYRKGVEPETYRQVMRGILERHRQVLDTSGIEVLAEKEAFLVDVMDYHDRLLEQRDAALHELGRLDEAITASRHAPSEPGGSLTRFERQAAPRSSSRSPWADPALKRRLDQFLESRRWLVHGRVLVLCDDIWLLETLTAPRWDDGADRASMEKRLLRQVARVDAASKDCVILVMIAPTVATVDAIRRAALVLKGGGALLVAVPALAEEPGRTDPFEPHPLETWMRSVLASGFPIEAFDVDACDGVLVSATARIGGAGRLPRLRFERQTGPEPWARGGLILAYHRVAELAPDTHGLCVSPECFRQQMRYLRQHCTVMPLVDLFLASRAGALPPRAVAVTFDDGYLDVLTAAGPVLSEEGIPATCFVNTERLAVEHEAWHDEVERIFLGDWELPPTLHLLLPRGVSHFDLRTAENRRAAQMTLHGALMAASSAERLELLETIGRWNGLALPPRPERRVLLAGEILALSRLPGLEIGSHSEHHLLLPSHEKSVQQSELRRAKESLEALLDRPVVSFAYPFGEHDERVENVARLTPHLLAATVEPGLVTASTDPMRLPRLEVQAGDLSAFAASVQLAFEGRQSVPPPGKTPRTWMMSVTMSSQEGAASAKNALDEAWAENDRRSRDEYRAARVVLSARPQFLIIDPSSRCNARCVMCPVSFRAPGDHGTDLAPSIFQQLAPLISFASQVNLFSSGEPTIANDIVHIIDETQRLCSRQAAIWLSTNGKRLSETILERLMAPQTGLQFSVDGGTKEVLESIRRGIAFEELCQSLSLVQRRRGTGPYPALSFSATISKRNLHDLANIFRLARTYGIEHVYFYEEDPEVSAEEAYVLDAADRPVFESLLPQIEESGVRYSNGLYFRGADGLRAIEPQPPANPPTLRCLAPWKVWHQRADGTVRTCCTLRSSMGDLNKQTFDEVWNGEEYVKLRRAFVDQSGIPGTCYRCTDPLRTWGAEDPQE